MVPSSLTWVQAYVSGAWFLCSWARQSLPRCVALGWDTVRTVLGPKTPRVGAAVATCQLRKGHVAFHPSGVNQDTSSGHPSAWECAHLKDCSPCQPWPQALGVGRLRVSSSAWVQPFLPVRPSPSSLWGSY